MVICSGGVRQIVERNGCELGESLGEGDGLATRKVICSGRTRQSGGHERASESAARTYTVAVVGTLQLYLLTLLLQG